MSDLDQNVLLQAPCGVVSFSEDGIITAANSYCCNLLGYAAGALTGNNISSILTLPGRIFYQTHLYPLTRLHKQAEEIFLNLQTRSKNEVPVVLNAIEIPDNGNGLIVWSFIPVVNRGKYEQEILLAKKNAEEALRKNEVLEQVKLELETQQKELDKQVTILKFQNNELLQIGNVITHDLQEPIRKLILFSHELLQGNLDGVKTDRALSVIKKSSQRVRNLLVNLQEYMGLTTGMPEKKPVDLSNLVYDQLNALKISYPQLQVQAIVAPLPVVMGNEAQLQLLFHQVLKNSFMHGATSSQLNLQIDAVIIKENFFNSLLNKYNYIDYVKITIADQGPGFENRYNEYIFGFLKKLNVAVSSDGFGLTFSRKIAENHFGTITAEGAAGKGATFTIRLPVNYMY